MSVSYEAVLWNNQKKNYDSVIAFSLIVYLAIFAGLGALIQPNTTAETLIIRALGTAAFLLLHIILCIGPLSRLDKRFLPLLYNRRHLGVTMFALALAHGTFSVIQFHAFGDIDPFLSLLTSKAGFQQFGFFALLILFLMAATSHDFWLKNLSAPVWKRLHMGVYVAYTLLIAHVSLGALQSERNWVLVALVFAGMATVVTCHLLAARKEQATDEAKHTPVSDGFIEVCEFQRIPQDRAVIVSLNGERIAVFRHENKVSAISNVCQHQNGPLGEGRIINGCITCPWHGYQYLPDSGMSPPPFKEKVPVFPAKIVDGKVFVHPCPKATTST